MTDRVWAEIDLSCLEHNLSEIRRQVGPNVEIMGVVKANAYGHGAVAVARRMRRLGARTLCVAAPSEATELREAGLEGPILILGATLPGEADAILNADASVTVSSTEVAEEFSGKVPAGSTLGVHLKMDTGMGRLGVPADQAVEAAARLDELPGLKLEGVLTHFPVSDEDRDFTEAQIALFDRTCKEIALRGISIPLRHAANSAAVGAHPNSCFDAVRPGIAVYGYDPLPPERRVLELKLVLSLKARVVLLKRFRPGETIGYGRTYTVKEELLGAVVPIGYADGLSRALSNRGAMLVRGRRVPIVGRISMDQTVVDVTQVPGVRLGEEVVIIGIQGNETISADALADLLGTIPHEVLTAVGPRVGRVYVKDGAPGLRA